MVVAVTLRPGLSFGLGILASVLCVCVSTAQTLTTFSDLPLRVNLGDTVRVAGVDGLAWQGHVLEMTPERIVVRVGPQRDVTLHARSLRELSLVGDPIGDGAAIGFGAGVALGLVGHYTVWRRTAASPVIHALLLGSLGAGVGALADAISRREVVVFRGSGLEARVVGFPAGAIQLLVAW